MTATRLHVPGHLRPRWRDLPGLAALAQRRLGPPALTPLTRPAACWLWLAALTVIHAGGRVLAHAGATVSVTGPRMTWPRRAAYTAALATAGTVSALWIWLPFEAAAHIRWPLAAGLIACAPAIALLCETGNMLLRGRAAVPATTTVHYLRRHHGGTWWEAGSLVAPEDNPLAAGRLVHQALHLADAHAAGLVVVPNSPATHRAYLRRGFTHGPLSPRVLIRPPHARTTPGTPAAPHPA
ncbi:hypothetical protein ABZ864_47690 [Streptomyces sp. NPDC047082]|uniref:hypothetical protein n=1 Tax=Streptomyces sp. NPDC047082 TaxID=3155259 RepID=UPI0033C442AF